MADLVIYRGTGEWSALYMDGKLERVGDHYLINERIEELLGIQVVDSDDFLRGSDGRETAQTLEEIETYRHLREDELRKAASARAEAELLLAAAAAVEARYKW